MGTQATTPTSSTGTLASLADRHELYERAVQEPEEEVVFLDQVFQTLRGRKARSLREDFCGTALLATCWVESAPDRTAIGVDLDAPTLDWAARHRVAPLGPRASDLELVCDDVLTVQTKSVDLVAALNFSYSLLHERGALVAYFERARACLVADGLFVLDFHAGPRTQERIIERTRYDGFTYVWEQGAMDALSGLATRAIHFRFPDGSQLRDAFSYAFRVWTVPELHDALRDAGFAHCEVHYEDFDEDGYSLGPPMRVESMTHEDSWIGYLVASD